MTGKDLGYGAAVWLAVGAMVLDQPVHQPLVQTVQTILFGILTLFLLYGVGRLMRDRQRDKKRHNAAQR